MQINIKNLRGISLDSSRIKPGYAFFAIRGLRFNGVDFIDQAIQNGARYIILADGEKVIEKSGIEYHYVENPRVTMAMVANQFYQPQPSDIVAVTGTNGKTSVANFVMQICHLSGFKSAAIGTLGVSTMDKLDMSGLTNDILTTPDPITLNSILKNLADKKVTHIALEASSHGLDLNRLCSIKFKAAGFTNLSQDHLDYHETYKNYFAAKRRLFSEILPEGSTAVLNRDINEYQALEKICVERNIKVIGYGKTPNSDIRITNISDNKLGLDLFGQNINVNFNLTGEFQAYNALCALGLAIAIGIPYEKAAKLLPLLKPIPGRMEKSRVLGNNASIFIDFAHTPDALKNVLINLRKSCIGRLHVLFGCGGERDQSKRKIMGQIAEELADHIIITDDNPRNEDPASIRAMINESCPSAQNIGGREEAIITAIRQLRKNDYLLIAGKGHETYQIIGNKKIHFSDHEIVNNFK